jgi:transcription elongation factor Elf1
MMAAGKQEEIVERHKYYVNRFTNKDRCPRCNAVNVSFFKKDRITWVCIECGTQFTPKSMVKLLRRKGASIKWKRP